MCLSVGHHAQQSAPGVVVLSVFLQMVGKFIDAFGEESHLDFCRAGVLVMYGCFVDYPSFLACC